MFSERIKWKFERLLPLLLAAGVTLPLSIYRLLSGRFFFGAESYHQLAMSKAAYPFYILISHMTIQQLLFLPFVFGLITVWLLSLLMRKFVSGKLEFYSMLLFVMSPVFIYSFSTLHPYSWSLMVVLIGLNILQSKFLKPFSPLIFALAVVDIYTSTVIIAALFIYWLFKRDNTADVVIVFSSAVVAAAYAFIIFLSNNQPILLRADFFPALIISEFGAIVGVSVFTLLLFLTGIIKKWKGTQRFALYTFLFYAAAAYYWHPDTLIISHIGIAILAGVGFHRIVSRRWRLPIMKELMIMLLISGVLFSTLAYTNERVSSFPSNEHMMAARWLSSQPLGVVLTYPEYESFFNYHTSFPSFFSGNSTNSSIFFERGLADVEKVLKNRSVSYIIIDSAMREGLVWNRPNEGMLFLLNRSERFKMVYNNAGVEVWLYEPMA